MFSRAGVKRCNLCAQREATGSLSHVPATFREVCSRDPRLRNKLGFMGGGVVLFQAGISAREDPELDSADVFLGLPGETSARERKVEVWVHGSRRRFLFLR